MPLKIRSVPAMAGADYRRRSELLFARLVADLQEVGDRDRRHDRGDEPRRAWRDHEPRRVTARDPLIEAEWADQQLAHRVPEPGASRGLLELARPRIALVLRERGAQRRGDLVLRDRPARLVAGHADERQIARRDLLWQPVPETPYEGAKRSREGAGEQR